MKNIFKITLLMTLLFGLLGSVSIPASANTKETFSWEFSAVTDPAQICDNGQVLIEDFTFYVDTTIHRTTTGEFFMQEEDVTMTGKVYLKEQPYKVLNYEKLQWKNWIKPSGAMPSSGILMKITIPGYGMVWQDIGHFIFAYDPVKGYIVPVKLSGKHEFMDLNGYPMVWNYSAPCQYLTSLP